MNLPNKLTLFRIALIPVFLFFFRELPEPLSLLLSFFGLDGAVRAFDAFVTGDGFFISGAVFVIAFATDALDGYIARKYKLVTEFGIFLDPVADKLLVTVALVALASRGDIGAWIPAIIISRELIITGLRLLAANKGIVLAAGGFGKAKTVVQSAALTLLLFQNFRLSFLVAVNAGVVLLYVALILTILSGIDYIVKNRSLLSM